MTSRTTRKAGAVVALAFLAALPPARARAEETAPDGPNFVVVGTTPEAAKLIAAAAEKHRKRLAELWLGKPLPPWSRPCYIHVELAGAQAGGATTFDYRVSPPTADMRLSGPFQPLMENVLPHEVAHTILADHFRRPLPRWADEGAAILSETGSGPQQYEQLARQQLSAGHALRLSYLFDLRDYPQDMRGMYTQGYAVSRFLVDRKDRAAYLRFVGTGMAEGWDAAAAKVYGFDTVNALEEAWVSSLRKR